MNISLQPSRKLRSLDRKPIRVPGDKSISHRSLLFGALSEGKTEISSILRSGDVHSTWGCLEAMGVRIEALGSGPSAKVLVHGVGVEGLRAPVRILDCGNSGTTMRLLMGILSGQPFSAEMTGDDSLRSRPMKRIAEPLSKMGARFELTNGNVAPLKVHGRRPLQPLSYELPVASAQLKSALLLAGLYADGETVLTGEIKSRDHTERMLPHFGAKLDVRADRIAIRGGQKLRGADVTVPGDISSAAFWIAAASIVPGTTLEIDWVSLNESRRGILDAVARMGVRIETEVLATHPEPVGKLRITSAPLRATRIEGEEVPALIDEIPILSVLATFAEGETVIRNAEELRVKETDRIEAVANGLRAMGVKLETFEDGLAIRGPQKLKGAKINSEHDHRIAMAFSIASLMADGPTEIEHAECVSISYPTFYETLQALAHE